MDQLTISFHSSATGGGGGQRGQLTPEMSRGRHVHGSQSRIYDPRRSLDQLQYWIHDPIGSYGEVRKKILDPIGSLGDVWDWISDPIGSLMEMVVSDL